MDSIFDQHALAAFCLFLVKLPLSPLTESCCTFVSHRHVIWASSSAGKPTFPGLADAFARAQSSGEPRDWEKVHYHLSVLSQAIDGAASMLAEVI